MWPIIARAARKNPYACPCPWQFLRPAWSSWVLHVHWRKRMAVQCWPRRRAKLPLHTLERPEHHCWTSRCAISNTSNVRPWWALHRRRVWTGGEAYYSIESTSRRLQRWTCCAERARAKCRRCWCHWRKISLRWKDQRGCYDVSHRRRNEKVSRSCLVGLQRRDIQRWRLC